MDIRVRELERDLLRFGDLGRGKQTWNLATYRKSGEHGSKTRNYQQFEGDCRSCLSSPRDDRSISIDSSWSNMGGGVSEETAALSWFHAALRRHLLLMGGERPWEPRWPLGTRQKLPGKSVAHRRHHPGEVLARGQTKSLGLPIGMQGELPTRAQHKWRAPNPRRRRALV